MTEYLKFGLQQFRHGDPQLRVDIPELVWEEARLREGFVPLVDWLQADGRKIININGPADQPHFVFNYGRFRGTQPNKETAAYVSVQVLQALGEVALDDAADPDFCASFDTSRESDSTLKPRFEMRWPTGVQAKDVAEAARTSMAHAGKQMRYEGLNSKVENVMGVIVDEELQTIDLHVHAANDKHMWTDPELFDSESNHVTLAHSTLRTHEEQLLALVGAVAIVRAPSLVKQAVLQ